MPEERRMVVVSSKGFFEGESLVVVALSFRLDTVDAYWLGLVTFHAPFPASWRIRVRLHSEASKHGERCASMALTKAACFCPFSNGILFRRWVISLTGLGGGRFS